MKVLLDSCAFLWLDQAAVDKFGNEALRLLDEGDITLVLSVASVWELAIKCGQGKLTLQTSLEEAIEEKVKTGRLQLLPVQASHALAVQTLPVHHRDPFDRLIIAQGIVEQLPVMTADNAFDLYGIERIWD